MKSTGIVRKIDELGRVVIPKELRKKYGINNGDLVDIYDDGDRILITKYNPVCHFCGASTNLVEHLEKNICEECIKTLSGK